MKTTAPLVYEFGPYRLEPGECRLSKQGQSVTLRPKLFTLLALLVERHGHMLERDELLDAVWPDTSVEESNLTVSINALRKALGGEQWIETVAGHGYRFAAEVKVNHTSVVAPPTALPEIEPTQPGGALPLYSRFYLERETDREFLTALARRDSLVLVKGARQIGKTSLLARGLQQAREAGAAVVLTDFQHITVTAFASVEKLLLTLAEMIGDQLDLPTLPHQMWNEHLSPSSNFERYLRHQALAHIEQPLVWALDEVDRLFRFDYAGEVFGLFRSWHNLRALQPAGPLQRLTLALAYATEAHLFITDLNQSPFNVGTRLTLADFTLAQIAELNRRYGAPLTNETALACFYQLLGGHPYLSQRGLYALTKNGGDLAALETEADESVFGDHLQRLAVAVEGEAALAAVLRKVLYGEPGLGLDDFYRLRSAGVLTGEAPHSARLRCELYARYLSKRWL